MSDLGKAHILVTKSEGYIPSARTAGALEALAVSLAEDASDDTQGFVYDPSKPALGATFNRELFSARISKPEPLQFCGGIFADRGDDSVCIGIHW